MRSRGAPRACIRGAHVLNRDPIDDFRPAKFVELDAVLNVVLGAGRSVNIDLMENGQTLETLISERASGRDYGERLWFSASVDILGENGFRRLSQEFPDSIVQCPVDFMAPLILAMP